MEILYIKPPTSVGLLLSYKCNIACKYCIYACSPKWKNDWLGEEDAEIILRQLSEIFKSNSLFIPGRINFSYGLHFTGGEPFLNYKLLIKFVKLADKLKIPNTFIETNCFWAKTDESTRLKLNELKEAGLAGLLLSVNPFNVEYIPFERIERVYKIGKKIFSQNLMVYQQFYLTFFKSLKLKNKMSFEEFLKNVNLNSFYNYTELLPMGRTPYKLGYLFKKYPADYFFNENCQEELTRNWHTHIDNHRNYIPGFCAGITLGDSKDLNLIFGKMNLAKKPIIAALASSLKVLYEIGFEFGYRVNKEGYISKCHLCEDIRKHLVSKTAEFSELSPKEFYENLN